MDQHDGETLGEFAARLIAGRDADIPDYFQPDPEHWYEEGYGEEAEHLRMFRSTQAYPTIDQTTRDGAPFKFEVRMIEEVYVDGPRAGEYTRNVYLVADDEIILGSRAAVHALANELKRFAEDYLPE